MPYARCCDWSFKSGEHFCDVTAYFSVLFYKRSIENGRSLFIQPDVSTRESLVKFESTYVCVYIYIYICVCVYMTGYFHVNNEQLRYSNVV